MGGIAQGAAVGRINKASVLEGTCEQVPRDIGADPARFGAEPALEQHRRRRQPDALVPVVGGDAGHFPGAVADAADNGGQDIGQLGTDHQKPLRVSLRRGDLEKRDQFTGSRQPALDQAVMADFQELLDAHACASQDFHDRPRPERLFLLEGKITSFPVPGISGPYPSDRRAVPCDHPGEPLPGRGERLAVPGLAGRLQQRLGCRAPLVDGLDQDRQDRQALAGAGVHA